MLCCPLHAQHPEQGKSAAHVEWVHDCKPIGWASQSKLRPPTSGEPAPHLSQQSPSAEAPSSTTSYSKPPHLAPNPHLASAPPLTPQACHGTLATCLLAGPQMCHPRCCPSCCPCSCGLRRPAHARSLHSEWSLLRGHLHRGASLSLYPDRHTGDSCSPWAICSRPHPQGPDPGWPQRSAQQTPSEQMASADRKANHNGDTDDVRAGLKTSQK